MVSKGNKRKRGKQLSFLKKMRTSWGRRVIKRRRSRGRQRIAG